MLWRNNMLRIVVLSVVFAAAIGLSNTAQAESKTVAIGEGTPVFCQRVDELTNRLLSKTNDFYKSYAPVRLDRDEVLSKRRIAFDKKLSELRGRAELDRKRHIDGMLDRVKSEDQRLAIQQYSEAIKVALDKRQSGVDEAIHNYRNTVDGELSRVQAARKANRQQFIDQMNTMINQAKADCNTTDGTIVSRQELLKAVTVAKETSAEDRMELENATKLIRQSHQDNKQQIGLAFTQFRESVEQARQQLVDVIGGLLQ